MVKICGHETNPTKSDQRYFQLLKAWGENKDIDFQFSDSHKKTYQVSDESTRKTLIAKLRKRMANSKNMIVIISNETNFNRGLLNTEIEWAVEEYKLPLIIVYPGKERILKPSLLEKMWPKKLKEYIDEDKVKCIHIPFKKIPILEALDSYSVVTSDYPKGSLTYYTIDTYEKWGL